MGKDGEDIAIGLDDIEYWTCDREGVASNKKEGKDLEHSQVEGELTTFFEKMRLPSFAARHCCSSCSSECGVGRCPAKIRIVPEIAHFWKRFSHLLHYPGTSSLLTAKIQVSSLSRPQIHDRTNNLEEEEEEVVRCVYYSF